ncbi:MAG: methylated-DNA--[protein]-cysteine S-methyltransferase [Bacteroidetes bacterium]|nr:methylated-DNA--[protein]-cysteine S-methyltransferase [Bacteroidota bacterium]
MNQIQIQYYNTTYGELILGSFKNKLCLCDWRYRKMRAAIDFRIIKGLDAEFVEKENKVIKNCIQQLEEYFAGERTQFDIPLLMTGTDFQKKVWNELLKIEYGSTSSYLQLAEKIGDKNAVRAVANANGANAISIIIPCHRIIGSKGELIGYAGGIKCKEKLLKLEKRLAKTEDIITPVQYSLDL